MSRLKKMFLKTERGVDKVKFALKDKLNWNNPVIIYPYRGFGNKDCVVIHGRVLEKEDLIHTEQIFSDSTWLNVKKVWKRYESDEVPGVEIIGIFAGKTAEAVSDEEGYFTLTFVDLDATQLNNGWNTAQLKITHIPFDLDFEEQAVAEVLFTKEKAEFGIISDIDDTIIESDILKPLKMISNVLLKNEQKRIAFKGVKKLYRELVKREKNPLFFVSGSSYNLYDMLTVFCRHNEIPKAPFIMRDLGFGDLQWIKQDSQEYKEENIKRILKMYPDLSFILIGDSGEKDPEIYLNIAKQFPDQVMAIYIRHVHSDLRENELIQLTRETTVPFLLMRDTQEAMDHAKENTWI